MRTERICILGSTGSIGRQALSLVDSLGIKVNAISAYSNIELLEEQALRFKPEYVVVVDSNAANTLRTKLAPTDIKVLSGKEALNEIVSIDSNDTILNSIVGVAGLEPTLYAIKANKKIALANKETLVSGGYLVRDALKKSKAEIIPVDSEHSAIFQCLEGSLDRTFSRIFLTASGGPFYGFTREQLEKVTLEQALKHPKWQMGRKITIDSATLMNKGLEFIEAIRLFNATPEQIIIMVHRQSIVHSMVEFIDSSVIAQLSVTDMRVAIQYALTYPERLVSPVEPLTIDMLSNLTFSYPDYDTFGCLRIAIEAAKKDGLVPAVVNASNEKAVELFLQEKIGFLDIERIVERCSNEVKNKEEFSFEELINVDSETRRKVDSIVKQEY